MSTLQYPYQYQCIPTILYNESDNKYDIINNTDMDSFVDLDAIEEDFFNGLINELKKEQFISDGVNSYLITWTKHGEDIVRLNVYNQINNDKFLMVPAKMVEQTYLLGTWDDIPMIRGQDYIKRAEEIDVDVYTFGINEHIGNCISELMTLLMSDTSEILISNSPVLEEFPLLDINSSDMDIVTEDEDADPASDDEFWEEVKQPIQHISDKQFEDHFEIFKLDENFKNSINNNFLEDLKNSACPICLCDFEENDKIIRNSSGHFLREECAKNYYQQKSKEIPTCPFSRQNPLEKQDGIKSIELLKAEYKIDCLQERFRQLEERFEKLKQVE